MTNVVTVLQNNQEHQDFFYQLLFCLDLSTGSRSNNVIDFFVTRCIDPETNMICIIFQYPVETYGYAVMFSLSGYLGVNIVLTLVKSFGALVAVTGMYI